MKELLQERIFEPTFLAQLRFPELRQPAQVQKVQGAADISQVARSNAEAVNTTKDLSVEDKGIGEAKQHAGGAVPLNWKTTKTNAENRLVPGLDLLIAWAF